MFEVILTGNKMLECFSCYGIFGSDWLITPKNIDILPDKVEYRSYSSTLYSKTYFKDEKDNNIDKTWLNDFSSLESREFIHCYFYDEEDAFYFKLKYG